MKLHENRQLFLDSINFASRPVEEGGIGISPLLIEKDYWICRSLKLMADSDPNHIAIFKGGTSLSKAYGIGHRFSEDIDVAISEAWTMTGNQLKNLIKRTAHCMSEGLEEVEIPSKTSKGSHFHKAYYRYQQLTDASAVTAVNPGLLLIEINSFGNPYPSEIRTISSFITDFLLKNENGQALITQYDMQPFDVPVLDKRRTLTEKLVSLIRCSLAKNYPTQLSAKIRHFYDLHHLLADNEVRTYLYSQAFVDDFTSLLAEDQQRFAKPEGWQEKTVGDSPLLSSLGDIWQQLTPTYEKELPTLAYKQIPSSTQIVESMKEIIERIR